MMSRLPPSPFLNSAASFLAASESAAAVEAAPTAAAAEPIPNSVGQVMLPAEAVAAPPPCIGRAATVPIGISVIRHNPITQAVEIRPLPVSPGDDRQSLPSGDQDEKLQILQNDAASGGLSISNMGRRAKGNMPVLQQLETSTEEASQRQDRSSEGENQTTAARCSSVRQDRETNLLSEMSHSNSETYSGRASRGLFETASDNVAVQELSRIRASNLATASIDQFRPALIGTLCPNGESEPSVTLAPSPGENLSDATGHIGEIFIGAAKIDNRRAEDFVDWPALEAALEEPLPLFIRDGAHLKRSAA
jgi:hypothetical protein